MLCLAGLQKRQFRNGMFVEKLQPSALFWTMQFVAQYVYEKTASLDTSSLKNSPVFFDRKANQNPIAGWIYFEIIVVVVHISERSGQPAR
jgi:hypothetical protein